VARQLSERLRTIIVDTSNEIAGSADIPHDGIGKARRMQVKTRAEQHGVLIEAVQNHNPQVIVIDEIGTAEGQCWYPHLLFLLIYKHEQSHKEECQWLVPLMECRCHH
jgi:hypothetical protein